jgi:hypothetical protein
VATTNYNFLQLNGSDTAGYNSINALITDIDNKLYTRVAVPGMIVLWDTSSGAVPTGWSSLTNSPANLPAVTGSYVYIKKDI